MTGRWLSCGVTALLACALAATPADAAGPPLAPAPAPSPAPTTPGSDALRSIQALYDALRPEEARARCDTVLGAGGLGLADHAAVLRLCTVVSATLDEGERTRALARLALTVDPAVKPPDEAGPRIRKVFDEARKWLAKNRLGLDHPAPSTGPSGEVVLVVRVAADPLGLVFGARARWRVGDGPWQATVLFARSGTDVTMPIAVPLPGGPAEYTLFATDRNGSVVAELGGGSAPLRATFAGSVAKGAATGGAGAGPVATGTGAGAGAGGGAGSAGLALAPGTGPSDPAPSHGPRAWVWATVVTVAIVALAGGGTAAYLLLRPKEAVLDFGVVVQ